MDLYFKKELTYIFEKHKFAFDIGNTLFSTFAIDKGTDILLRNIKLVTAPQKILDMGCGCGVIGIVLAKKYPNSEVISIDKDLLAIRYTNLNAIKNKVKNIKAIGSVATEAVSDQKFDLIVSNVPAKIGDEAITHDFILKPLELLNEDGSLWIVVMTSLNRLIPKVGRQYQLKMKEIKKRNGHSVYEIKK